MSTISGAVFDHKSETPGLGAEISLGWFQEPFIGKTIFEGTELVSIKVVKGGAKEDDMHAVDGISGGTITADGVNDMLAERFGKYLPFFKKKIFYYLNSGKFPSNCYWNYPIFPKSLWSFYVI